MFTPRFPKLKYEFPKPELIRNSFSRQKVYSNKQYMFFEVKQLAVLLRACKHKANSFAAGSKKEGSGGESMFCPRPLVMGEKQKNL